MKRLKTDFISHGQQINVTFYDLKPVKRSNNQSRQLRPVAVSTTPVKFSHTRESNGEIRVPNPVKVAGPIEDQPVEEHVISFQAADETQKRKGKTQHHMMDDWLLRQEQYLSIFLDQEALPAGNIACTCGSGQTSSFRCSNCHGNTGYCSQCILHQHRHLPLHRIKQWNGFFLEDISLSKLGLVTFFGHGGDPCPSASIPTQLLVLHIDGFHEISVSFCRCESAEADDLQLFRLKLFASTVHTPKSAFTFDLLEHYRLHHLEGKASAHTYIQSLYRLTDDEGSSEVPDRVREFRRVAKQWNYLVLRKRAGRYGLHLLSQSLVFHCPACPRPGINMPHNWYEILPAGKHWLARRFIHFDANFRLVLLKRDNRDSGDRGLWNGPGFFVDSNTYEKYLERAGEVQQEKSNCVNHRAVLLTTMSRNHRFEVTGVAGGVCRHECAIANGFVNLHKGERYVNSDFAISNILSEIGKNQEVVLSYDIACQYSRNFKARFAKLPEFLCAATHLGLLLFLVPKFHLPAHQQDCRYLFSFTYAAYVGRTDGEAIERFWSTHNHLSGSTMRMTPLSRLDTLNFHFNDWNWRKSCKMGATIIQRLTNTRRLEASHKELYEDLKKAIDDSKVAEWINMESKFKSEQGTQGTRGTRSVYQPISEKVPTREEILVRLADSGSRSRPIGGDDGTQATIPVWINDGIDIESQQEKLAMDAKSLGANPTTDQRNAIDQRRKDLLKLIIDWKNRSPLGFDALGDDDNDERDPESIILPLPSSMPISDQNPTFCSVEKELREAQAYELLQSLRKSLAERVALQRNQSRDQNGQDARTRSSAVINRATSQINKIAKRYRTTFEALEALGAVPHPQLKELKSGDISAKNVFEYTRQVGRVLDTDVSWIWRQVPMGEDISSDSWLEEVLRVQFLESKANYDRCREECELLLAELGYTWGTFRYMQALWRERASNALSIGAQAHGYHMTNLYQTMADQVAVKLKGFAKETEKSSSTPTLGTTTIVSST